MADRFDPQVGGMDVQLLRQLQYVTERGGVVRELRLRGAFFRTGTGQVAAAHGQRAHGLTDPLDQRPGQLTLDGGVEDLQLQGGGAGVDDEHAGHESLPWRSPTPCAWTAVMATVLTMSSTSAPRDRSLIGLRSPWRTGPIATAPAVRCTAL